MGSREDQHHLPEPRTETALATTNWNNPEYLLFELDLKVVYFYMVWTSMYSELVLIDGLLNTFWIGDVHWKKKQCHFTDQIENSQPTILFQHYGTWFFLWYWDLNCILSRRVYTYNINTYLNAILTIYKIWQDMVCSKGNPVGVIHQEKKHVLLPIK